MKLIKAVWPKMSLQFGGNNIIIIHTHRINMQLLLYMKTHAQLLIQNRGGKSYITSIQFCIKAQERGRNRCYENNWNAMQQLFDNKAAKICLTKKIMKHFGMDSIWESAPLIKVATFIQI